jgi:SpoVK/Ycf46/Vps4 family AAA+-type ATPase
MQAPFWKLDDVCIDTYSKNQILTALTIIQNVDKIYREWGLEKIFKNNRSVVLNFYGPSGTGKTMAAEAIASHLGKNLLVVNYSELESKYVGETPKNISAIFRAAEESGAVIVFDEADSFLGKRLTNVSQSADYGVNVTRSVMLMEIEKYSGVIVFTTNLITNYDEAFKRRILANVEFKLPDATARQRIWQTHIPKELPVAGDAAPDILAGRYEGISGADIKDMVLFAAVACIRENGSHVSLARFDSAYEYINKRNHYETDGSGSIEVIESKEITQEEYEKEMEGTR